MLKNIKESRAFYVLLFTFLSFQISAQLPGSIEVYFNQKVDPSFSNGSHPLSASPEVILAAAIEKVNQAHRSIDVTMYNCDQKGFVNALIAAKNRGVRVRYITGDEGANSALNNSDLNFTYLKGNLGQGLMHNKFIVIDAENHDSSLVWTGSLNFTTGNIYSDYNNVVCIYDQSLALNYRKEFEEMWGGQGSEPDMDISRFGDYKTDNTIHQFVVGGIQIESYFSPSDGVSAKIIKALHTANEEILFALLTFTRDEIADEIIDRFDDGVEVRGLIDSPNDSGSEFNYLNNQGLSVLEHSASTQCHHKYVVVDATLPESDPLVLTGSHNWTTAAETRNDENTLVLHSPWIANLFKQEFEARWCEETDGNCELSSAQDLSNFEKGIIWPIPATQNLFVKSPSGQTINWIKVFDSVGHLIQAGKYLPQEILQIQVGHLADGPYWIQYGNEEKAWTSQFVKI
ncbi:MAG: phospholipase D-like domain-containing protein [Saprospiraceae bacterium]